MTTVNEQKQTGALSKGAKKRPPKIVLGNPFAKYWPEINETDARIVNDLLQKLLVKEREKPRIPWKKIIKLTKILRKECMKNIYEEKPISDELCKQRKYVKVGLNAVERAIRRTCISSCLLAGDVEPDTVISHLVTLASTRGVPVLIVPNLKDNMSRILGFSCTALGLSTEDDGQYLKPLDTLIKRLCDQFPVPLHYGWMCDKANIDERRKTIHGCRKSINSKTKRKIDECSGAAIGDFFIDCTPGPGLETIRKETEEEKNINNEFIPLNLGPSAEQVEKSSNQLYEDYINNLLYIAPNFIRMQKNCNKQKKKRYSC